MSPAERPARRSCRLDFASCSSRQEGRAGHTPQPGLVVDGFEQPTVERDVDPPRGASVQQQRQASVRSPPSWRPRLARSVSVRSGRAVEGLEHPRVRARGRRPCNVGNRDAGGTQVLGEPGQTDVHHARAVREQVGSGQFRASGIQVQNRLQDIRLTRVRASAPPSCGRGPNATVTSWVHECVEALHGGDRSLERSFPAGEAAGAESRIGHGRATRCRAERGRHAPGADDGSGAFRASGVELRLRLQVPPVPDMKPCDTKTSGIVRLAGQQACRWRLRRGEQTSYDIANSTPPVLRG